MEEAAKEGASAVVDRVGAAAGAVAGLVVGQLGAPATASVVTGTIVGSTMTVVGKAVVTVSTGRLRSRRAGLAARADTGGSTVAVEDLKASISQVIREIEAAWTELTGLSGETADSQQGIAAVLTGADTRVLRGMNGGMTGARESITGSLAALRQAKEELRSYLSAI
jgi:hypothetical protein